MAVIVAISAVVAQKAHGVARHNVLRMFLHKRLHTIPQRRDGFDVFVQTQDEAVFLFVRLHEQEWIVVDVAVQLDARLDTPVPLELEHQGVSEEEARLESAHMAVADGIAVDDLLLRHVLSYFSCFILVDE